MFDQLVAFVKEQFATNQFLAGGLFVSIGLAIWAMVKSWPTKAGTWLKKQFMVVIDITDRDDAFEWMVKWLAAHNYSQNRARLLTVETRRDRTDRDETRPKIIFSPAPGTHFLWYKHRLMVLTREREDPKSDGNKSSRLPFREYFTIRLFGRRRDIAFDLLNEARELAMPKEERKIQIHKAGYGGDWINMSGRRSIRPLDTIVLKEGKMETLVQDIQQFLESREWYAERGIPYRRGYMLYGPPGNGKSSAVLGLATHFLLDIGIISLHDENIDDSALIQAVSNPPSHTLLLLEDIDCAVEGRVIDDSKLTFSGLLNAVDGVTSPEGQIIIMTTNHLEKLDGALIRPGRCDVKMKFPNSDHQQATRMFDRFFPNDPRGVQFAAALPPDVSMSQLQGHFLIHRDDPDLAVKRAPNIKEDL